ncbi:hypothetical protein B0H14DRAFT_2589950 [Mycena olivaceomarginata]|nr:hypothetical protein B0H14DRAFT_2589950 [Mycena olivaceomarginata]
MVGSGLRFSPTQARPSPAQAPGFQARPDPDNTSHVNSALPEPRGDRVAGTGYEDGAPSTEEYRRAGRKSPPRAAQGLRRGELPAARGTHRAEVESAGYGGMHTRAAPALMVVEQAGWATSRARPYAHPDNADHSRAWRVERGHGGFRWVLRRPKLDTAALRKVDAAWFQQAGR